MRAITVREATKEEKTRGMKGWRLMDEHDFTEHLGRLVEDEMQGKGRTIVLWYDPETEETRYRLV